MATGDAYANGMGLGLLGGPSLVFKRKYRWTLAIDPYCSGLGVIPPNFVKLASRPNLSIEETEINFLNGKMFIPGKGTWETVTVTYYDVGGNGGAAGMGYLYSWLATVYNFTGKATGSVGGGSSGVNPLNNLQQSSALGNSGTSGYGADATLTLYDGCGAQMEQWVMTGAWPQAVNFGELDYSSSEEVTIELTLRYINAVYTSLCPQLAITPCCNGC